MKTDSLGVLQWSKTYGGNGLDVFYSAQQTSDSGYILLGTTSSFDPLGNTHYYLVRTTATGDTLWTRTFGGSQNEFAYGVQETTDKGFVITGYSNSFLGPDTSAVYEIKTDISGNSGCSDSSTNSLVTDPSTVTKRVPTKVKSGGTIVGSPVIPEINGGASTLTLCIAVGIEAPVSKDAFIVYPNPSTGTFVISSDHVIRQATIQLFDLMGQKIWEETISASSSQEFHLKNVSSGVYLMKVKDDGQEFIHELIIE